MVQATDAAQSSGRQGAAGPASPPPRRLVRVFLLTLAALAFLLGGVVGPIRDGLAGRGGTDFHGYYFTAMALRETPRTSVYDHAAMVARSREATGVDRVAPFVYPPLFAALFVPFTFLPLAVARVVWLLLGQVCLAGTVLLLARMLATRAGAALPAGLAVAFFLVHGGVFYPTLDHLWQGQSNFIVLLLVTAAFQLGERGASPGREATGAGLLALAVSCKLIPLVFVGTLLAWRRWRFAAATLAATALLVLASLPLVGWSDWRAFPDVLTGSRYLSTGATPGNYSAVAVVGTLAGALGLGGDLGHALVLAVQLAVGGLFLVQAWRDSRDGSLAAGAAGLARQAQAYLLVAFAMAAFWEHHLVFTVPAFLVLLALWSSGVVRTRAVAALAIAAWLVVALPTRPLWPWGPVSLLGLLGTLPGVATPEQAIARLPALLWGFKLVGVVLCAAALELAIARLRSAPSPPPASA